MSPDAEVIWYIYTGITHAYSDGASGNALLQDLLRLYAEAGGNGGSSKIFLLDFLGHKDQILEKLE